MDALRNFMRRKKRQKDWSKLASDLLRPILESLSSKDFYRAKSVCSDWYSISKTCIRGSLCPWLITYQGSALTLFDLQEERTKLLGLDFLSQDSFCMASSGNWVLIVDSCLSFCILNLVTCKRINLPSTHSSTQRVGWLKNDIIGCKNSAVLWVDEKTEDYVVAWIYKQNQFFSIKKGEPWWRKWNHRGTNSGFYDMAYKNCKLYLYTLDHHIKILDFSGHKPKVLGIENPYLNYPFNFVEKSWEYIWKRRIAIQDSGEVLIILSLKAIDEEKTLFYIFKMNLENKKWERVDSIGDNEMLIFGHGVTIRAPVQNAGDGIKSDTICFVEEDVWPDSNHPSNCGVFDLSTSKITWPKRFGFGGYIDKSRWFVPEFSDGLCGQEAEPVQVLPLVSTFGEHKRSLRRPYVLLISVLLVFMVNVAVLIERYLNR